MSMTKTLTTAVALSSTLTFAANLSVPVAFDNAKVLPKGVRNLRYNAVYAEANDKFSSGGTIVPVGDALNVDVSYNKLIEGGDTAVERGVLGGYLLKDPKDENTPKIDLNSSAGKTTGVVNVEVDVKAPVFAMGITRKWTAAVVVPIYKTKMNVDTGFIASESLKRISDQLVDENKEFKAIETRDKTDSAIYDKVIKYGYKPLRNEEKDMLGDIKLVNKIQLSKKDNYAYSLLFGVTLPTGEQADIDKAVDVPAGDGQVDYELGFLMDFQLTGKLSLSTKASYTIQASDTTAKRVPEVRDSTLTPDIDPQLERDLGDIIYTSFGVNYQMDLGPVLRAQYSFQYKEEDIHNGNKYASERYEWMGQDTRQNLHALSISAGYSTIPAFKRKQFPLPMELNLTLGRPLAGKNVTKDSTIVFDSSIYF